MVRVSALLGLLLMMAAWMQAAEPETLVLREGWAIQSSVAVKAEGEAISTPGFSTRGWYPAQVPSTVIGALVARGIYSDPATGMNLRSIPGTSYPIAADFSALPMPPESPFREPWWFRTEFQVPAAFAGKTIRLGFDGINFRVSVWLNGKQVAERSRMAGTWRVFEFDVTGTLRPGAANALAVVVEPPRPDDLALTFVDWNPLPPDKNMGIWREVRLRAAGPVALRWPQVRTHLNVPRMDQADLTVSAELRNDSALTVTGWLKGCIENLAFSQEVTLAPHEAREVSFDPKRFPVLHIQAPRLWWPSQTGPQNLHRLQLSFETTGGVSDQAQLRFGIREATSYLDAKGHRVFQINGKNILIRGAGYTFDVLLRSSPERQEAELKYVRDMNLNAVRLEGKLEDEHFLDLCDEYGILVLAGWSCCDHWERWDQWKPEDLPIASASLRDQARRLRSHASAFAWLNGSDFPPPEAVERAYLRVLEEVHWPASVVSSAADKATPVTGPSGVKMTGPYDYVAPSYWLQDEGKRGGAHGFNTETGPGPSVPPIESLRRMLPEDHLWPVDSVWNFHAGGGVFQDIKVFTEALDQRYGPSRGVEEFARKAQVQAYEGRRAMFEAYGRNKYTSTGVIHWMLNNAWPSLIWHLYDWYLRPGGAYFGTKKACEPLHIQYSYDDASVVVVNSRYESFKGLRVRARLLNLDMTEKFAREVKVDVAGDSANRVFKLPAVEGLAPTYFLRLDLASAEGKELSSNLYWLSTRREELDWDHSLWYRTPTRVFADYGALQALPPAALNVVGRAELRQGEGRVSVTVENPGKAIAFFVRLKVNGTDGEEILPVLWEDNYFSLLPGEQRTIAATFPHHTPNTAAAGEAPAEGVPGAGPKKVRFEPQVEVSGWNVLPMRIPAVP